MMLWRRLATLGAVIGLAVGLGSTPASAAPGISTFENKAAPARNCLDFRADYGPYVFGCNFTSYQKWYWNDEFEYTALRQKATGLCLVSRNGQATMKPCSAADDAALWTITPNEVDGATIKNAVSHKCLARMANDRVNTTTCTGGKSQRWQIGWIA
ncbi:RICIN domain-containing protein [Streptomyces sp. NPDC055955]|uniref:RICIN domain-containing protein n=1 Tax=Streptomyces sp. NPDC055955 TaxID=3345665 RepID=UPI0035DA2BAE